MANSDTNQKSWLDAVDLNTVGGDVIVVQIGDNAQNVAAGKNVSQQIQAALGDNQAGDAQAVAESISTLRAEFDKVKQSLKSDIAALGEYQIDQLEKQLAESEDPSSDLLTQAGEWLIDNVPNFAEPLLSLFMPAPVGRAVAKAGEAAIVWLKKLQAKVNS